jgi:RNA polymerase sigma-70 factor (ECF subfamily)
MESDVSSRPLYRKSMPALPRCELRDGPITYWPGFSRLLPPVAPREPAPAQHEPPVAPPRKLPPSDARSVPDSWHAAYDQGRRAWPSFGLTFEEFADHLAALGHRDAPPHAADLYLAVACQLGSRAAFQVLEREFIVTARAAIQGVVRDPWVVDDVLQDVRRRLFVGPESKVACYRGAGSLGSWIRTIAINSARDYVRNEVARRRREELQRSYFLHGAEEFHFPDDDLAHDFAWQGTGAACIEAVRGAFQSLEARERELLQDYYLRGLSIDGLAPLYAVNRATVARRIRKCTAELGRQMRKRLARLYPRENVRTLDAIAFAACRNLIVDAASLLASSGSTGAV